MIEGQTVKMGGKEFIVPPLNFQRLKRLKADMEALQAADPTTSNLSDAQFEASITIIHAALTRNYPDLSRDEVEDLLDLGNLPHVMAAVMGQSGLVKTGE